jgi:hypothetical protein
MQVFVSAKHLRHSPELICGDAIQGLHPHLVQELVNQAPHLIVSSLELGHEVGNCGGMKRADLQSTHPSGVPHPPVTRLQVAQECGHE